MIICSDKSVRSSIFQIILHCINIILEFYEEIDLTKEFVYKLYLILNL